MNLRISNKWKEIEEEINSVVGERIGIVKSSEFGFAIFMFVAEKMLKMLFGYRTC